MEITKQKAKRERRATVTASISLTHALAGALRAESYETKKNISQIIREALRARYINAGDTATIQQP